MGRIGVSLVLGLWLSCALACAAEPLSVYATNLMRHYETNPFDTVVSPKLRAGVDQLLGKMDAAGEHPEIVARAVWDARLQQLQTMKDASGASLFSVDELAKMRSAFNLAEVDTSSSSLNGGYSPDRIRVPIPQNMRGSWIHYGILLHELEHLVQDALGQKWGDSEWVSTKRGWELRLKPGEKFLGELGSMSFEAAYMRLMPFRDRRQAQVMLQKAVQLGDDSRRLGLRFTSIPPGDISEHLQREWRSGRYGWDQTEPKREMHPEILAAFPAASHAYKGGMISAICNWGWSLVKSIAGG
jgi:hypothetical protein